MKIHTWSLAPLSVFNSTYLSELIGFPYNSLAAADVYANEMCDLVDRHPASPSPGCARGEYRENDNAIMYWSHSGKEYQIEQGVDGGYVLTVPADSSVINDLLDKVKQEWQRASHCVDHEIYAANPILEA